MKQYTKTHRNAKALKNHVTSLRKRGATIDINGNTIKYSFPVMKLTLEAVPNVDFSYDPQEKHKKITLKKVEAQSVEDAQKKFQSFINKNDLGGGNLTKKSGQLEQNGVVIGRISYNNRYWPSDG